MTLSSFIRNVWDFFNTYVNKITPEIVFEKGFKVSFANLKEYHPTMKADVIFDTFQSEYILALVPTYENYLFEIWEIEECLHKITLLSFL